MAAAFKFLKMHFPLEGLSLHVFEPQLRVMHLLFLVTKESFHYLDVLVPIPDAVVEDTSAALTGPKKWDYRKSGGNPFDSGGCTHHCCYTS
jgi:hypothetical protein